MADSDRPKKKARSEQGQDPAEPKHKAKPKQKVPVLPWMRAPVSTGTGSNIKLRDVKGLEQSILEALQAGEQEHRHKISP